MSKSAFMTTRLLFLLSIAVLAVYDWKLALIMSPTIVLANIIFAQATIMSVSQSTSGMFQNMQKMEQAKAQAKAPKKSVKTDKELQAKADKETNEK